MAVLVPVDDPGDPRASDFAGLRERSAEDDSGWLVAEGPLVVRQLLASDYRQNGEGLPQATGSSPRR